jgi:hypothetical protein
MIRGRKKMEQTVEDRLRELIGNLPPEDVNAIIAFAQFLFERRLAVRETREEFELSDTEHATIVHVLDAVAALSADTGPPVSNREHDRYLYGES